MDKDSRTTYLAALLILIGFGMRVFGAWCFSQAHTADHGIIGLMVKHILEGRELPVFFYGLPYMGAIEPYTSVLLCRVFGMTDFMINMGTALMGILLLPVVYLWGRAAGGRTAGLAALAFCVIGPEFYFQFQSWADGGYAAILLFDALILWIGIGILNRARKEGKIRPGGYLAMGLLAGIGWFLSPLILSALVTVALLYLAVLRRRVFRWHLVYAGLAFIVGSLPLWIWNIHNHWQTFDMLNSHGRPALWQGLKLFYVDRLFKLLDLDRMHPILHWVTLGLYILAAVFCISYLLGNLLRRNLRDDHLHLLAALLFIVVSSLLFTRSHLALAPAVRYLLPIIPALAVILGVATSLWSRRFSWRIGWLPMFLLVAYQGAKLPKRNRERLAFEAFAEKAERFAGFLEANDVTHIYTRYQVHWANHGLNFMLGERFVFSDLGRERYRPYARSMENADEVAVLNDLGGFSAFLDATGGSAAVGGLDGLTLHYNIQPPEDSLAEIEPSRFLRIEDGAGRSLLETLSDGDFDSSVNLCAQGENGGRLELSFDEPIPLSAIRLAVPATARPKAWRVSVKRSEGEGWALVKNNRRVTAYYWSGPRFFWGGDSFRLETRFDEQVAGQVRIDLEFMPGMPACDLAELQVFGPAQTVPRDGWEVSELVGVLSEVGATDLYADRWLANRLAREFDGGVEVLRDRDFGENVLERRFELSSGTAFIVEDAELPLTRRVVAEAGVRMAEKDVGRWTVLYFDRPSWNEEYAQSPALSFYWKGYAPLLYRDKRFCAYLGDRARRWKEQGKLEQARAVLRKALDVYPNYQPGLLRMAELNRELGRVDLADRFEQEYRNRSTPSIPARVRFRNGIEFLGVDFDSSEVVGGETVALRYYWTLPEDLDPSLFAVFVHFKADSEVHFQEDHVLLPGADTSPQPFDEVFVEKRVLSIPDEIAAGKYTVDMGVYSRTGPGMRLSFKTDLVKSGFRAFRLPLEFEVVEREN